jgi:hypothetical protein
MNFKKLLVLTLLVFLSISLVACGNSADQKLGNESNTTKSDNNADVDNNDSNSIEVDENLLTVDITLPSSFFEGMTEEEIISNVEKEGYLSTRVNSDGSVTHTMTKAKRNEKLKDMKVTIDETIVELLEGDDRVESFVKIDYNNNLSKVDIYVDPDIYSEWDSMYAIQFYLLGSFYQRFDGVPPEELDVVVNFINDRSGDVLKSSSYRSWADNMNGNNLVVNNTEDTSSNTGSITPKKIKLNETVTIGDLMEITITDSEWVETILPSNTSGMYSYYDDEDGEKYFVIRGKLKNNGSEDLDIQWINDSEIVLNGTYKFTANMELESNDGSDFYGSAKPLQTLNLLIYASVSDEAYEIWESIDVTMKILSDGEYANNFFDEDYPHEILNISFTK